MAKTSKTRRPDVRPRCEGLNQNGKRCTYKARPNERFCGRHLSQEGHGGAPRAIERVIDAERNTTVGARIVSAVGAGATKAIAAASAGVSESALMKWQQRGTRWIDDEGNVAADTPGSETVFVEFVQALKRAEASSVTSAVAVIRQAATGRAPAFILDPQNGEIVRDAKGNPIVDDGQPGQWQAAAWIAERRAPADYARPTRIRHEGSIDTGASSDTVRDLSEIPVDKRERLLELRREEEKILAEAREEEAAP